MGEEKRPDTMLVRILFGVERALLYVVATTLLALGLGIVGIEVDAVIRSNASWSERFISVLEGLLLTLIVVEIFVTVMAHIRGARLRLEPFIVVGIIAVVRHILGIVIRLSVPKTATESQAQLVELAINAGAALVLVAALALARWSQRSGEP